MVSDELPENVGSPYWNLVSVTAQRADGSQASQITGAVFGSAPHIVSVNEYHDLLAFQPREEGGRGGSTILSFRNEDRPGAISEVLDILHDANVNIASLNVARPKQTLTQGQTEGREKKLALCFMALDDDVSTKAFNAIRNLPFLQDVNKIQLR